MMSVVFVGAVGLALCAALGWFAGPIAGAALWAAFGIFSLIIYLKEWVDTPPIWYWPVIVALWPLVWSGGIIHPLR